MNNSIDPSDEMIQAALDVPHPSADPQAWGVKGRYTSKDDPEYPKYSSACDRYAQIKLRAFELIEQRLGITKSDPTTAAPQIPDDEETVKRRCEAIVASVRKTGTGFGPIQIVLYRTAERKTCMPMGWLGDVYDGLGSMIIRKTGSTRDDVLRALEEAAGVTSGNRERSDG